MVDYVAIKGEINSSLNLIKEKFILKISEIIH